MKRLSHVRVGIILLMGLLSAIVLLPGPSVADARVVSEGEVTSGGFDCADVAQIPQTECEALVAFYYATGGDEWWSGGGWLVTNTPCEWDGITCEAGHVTGLEKGDLVGSIAVELANLSQLRLLSIGANSNLSGVIPPELGTLSQLETFTLYHNYELSIPPELGNLSALRELRITTDFGPAEPGDQSDLHARHGGAVIPPELGNLSALETLVISRSVGGTIPPELGNLSNLQVLDLSENGPLTGSIPPELGNLSNLTHLHLNASLHNCGAPPTWLLNGPLPPELGNLANLQVLTLSCQNFTGPFPMTLTNLLELNELDYFWTDLCEPPDQAFQDWIAGVQNVSPSPGILCEPTSLPLYLPLVMR